MRVACWLVMIVTRVSNFAVIWSCEAWGEDLLAGLVDADAVEGSSDLVEVEDAELRWRDCGCNVDTMERFDVVELVLGLEDANDLDPEDLEERLGLEMRGGIERVDSCEGMVVLGVWSGVSGGYKTEGFLLFLLILRSSDHTGKGR